MYNVILYFVIWYYIQYSTAKYKIIKTGTVKVITLFHYYGKRRLVEKELIDEADPPPAPSPHSSSLMLGAYISIFVILAAILFVCAIYSCLGVSAFFFMGTLYEWPIMYPEELA